MQGRRRLGYAASRAHHADVGGMAAGSMPMSRELVQEGLILPPVRLLANGRRNPDVWSLLMRNVRTPREREGDLLAQVAANRTACTRAAELAARTDWESSCQALLRHSERLVAAGLRALPRGRGSAEDFLDDQGERVPIRVTVELGDGELRCDFTGTAPARRSNLNAPFPVTSAAVYYAVLCLLGGKAPVNQGAFRPITIQAQTGSLVNPPAWAAVAAGNVETSQRIVDVVFQALGQLVEVPACSAGTMNNLVLGGLDWAYYETSGGGAGAARGQAGGSGLQVHMTNTRNTPAESLESDHPLRLRRYALRRGSGGSGQEKGGDGLVRELELLQDATVSLLAQRRTSGPPGAAGGEPGEPGEDHLELPDGTRERLPGQFTRELPAGSVLSIQTPGGGGWGRPK
jgi:N-methylhydantoinase B